MSKFRTAARWALRAAVAIGVLIGGVIVLDCTVVRAEARGERLESMRNSSQWSQDDQRFVNRLPIQMSLLPVLGKMARGGPDHRRPEAGMPVVERRAEDFSRPPPSGLRITWLGHSTSLIEVDGVRLLLDPVWAERASPLEFVGPKRFHRAPLPLEELAKLKLDAVVISHDHYDHLDKDSIKLLKDQVPIFVTPLGVGAYLERWGVAPERIVERDWWGEVKVGTVKLVATPARHFSGRSLVMAGADRTLWSGWAIVGPEHRVYFSGDSGMFPGFAEIGERLGPFDAALIETGAYDPLWADVHLGPEQAIQAHAMVRGGVFIPVHWGTFDLAMHNWTEPVERAIAAARKRGVSVAVPRPGQSLEPTAGVKLERWWPDLPWSSAEETAVVSSGLSLVRDGIGNLASD